MRVGLRYTASKTQSDRADQTLSYTVPIRDWLSGETAVRLAVSRFDLHTFGYKGELVLPFLGYLSVRLRLAHSLQLPMGISTSHLLGAGQFSFPLFSSFRLFGGFGWFERFHRLSKASVSPTFSKDPGDHDFAADFGCEISPVNRLFTELKIGTFEEIDVFNLNHPFLQTTFTYTTDTQWILSALVRYSVLLGFGRLDSWVIGAGVQLPLGTDTE